MASNLVVYQKAYQILYGKLQKLASLIEKLDTVCLTIDKMDLTDLAIKQINKVEYSIEDQQEQIEEITQFLKSADLRCFESPTKLNSFKIRLFTAKGLEKSIFLGTPLDWFNISEQLLEIAYYLKEAKIDADSVEEARMGVFDLKMLEVAYREKVIQIINALRGNLVAVKGYALYRVESVLGASTDFYVKDLLDVCLQALPILEEMIATCDIPNIPLKNYYFSPDAPYQIKDVTPDQLRLVFGVSNC